MRNEQGGSTIRRRQSLVFQATSSLWQHRNLAIELIKRDIKERYVSQTLSWAWLVVQPAITTLIYLVVFTFVFNARVGASSSRGDYVVFLLSGLIPWLAISDILNRAVTAVSSTPVFVKQMVFPVEALPMKIFGSAALSFLLSTTIFFLFVFGTGHGTLFILFGWPASVLCLTVFLVGASFLLSAIGVFLKDIKDIVQLYTSIGLFASPVLFSLDSIPVLLKSVIVLNPVTPFILMFQDSIFGGGANHVLAWIIGPLLAFATLLLGLQIFVTARPTMADVL